MSNFADRLLAAIESKHSHVVVGLDPDYRHLPPELRERHEARPYGSELERVVSAYREFLLAIINALVEEAVAVKPQLACFEACGWRGYRLYEELVQVASDLGYLVIADAKRGDIGSTAEAYASAHLKLVSADALTVNAWFGTDGLEPFLRRAREEGTGVFVLVKTSNPGSAEIQDLRLSTGGTIYERVAELVLKWAEGTIGERGYASVGAVVGATHPAQARSLRERLPGIIFLVPGYGAQGAGAEDLAGVFDQEGTGTVVNSARAILYAYKQRGGPWLEATRAEARAMRLSLWAVARRGEGIGVGR